MGGCAHAHPPDAVLVWGRAVVLTGFTFLVGALGHVTAGGLLPGAPVLVLLLGTGTTLAAAFLGRPASARLLVALVVVGQTLVHGALSLTAGHGRGPRRDRDPVVPLHATGARVAAHGAGGRVGSLQDHYEASVGAPAADGAHRAGPGGPPGPPADVPRPRRRRRAGRAVAGHGGARRVGPARPGRARRAGPAGRRAPPAHPRPRPRPASRTSTRCTARRATASRAASYAVVRRPSSPPDPTPSTASRRRPACAVEASYAPRGDP